MVSALSTLTLFVLKFAYIVLLRFMLAAVLIFVVLTPASLFRLHPMIRMLPER